MSNKIVVAVGNTLVALDDFKALSNDDKLEVVKAMFGEVSADQDGELVVHTDLMLNGNNVVEHVIEPAEGEAEIVDPYEDEEEPLTQFLNDEELPPTLRPEELELYYC